MQKLLLYRNLNVAIFEEASRRSHRRKVCLSETTPGEGFYSAWLAGGLGGRRVL